jgi:hypothetical protein
LAAPLRRHSSTGRRTPLRCRTVKWSRRPTQAAVIGVAWLMHSGVLGILHAEATFHSPMAFKRVGKRRPPLTSRRGARTVRPPIRRSVSLVARHADHADPDLRRRGRVPRRPEALVCQPRESKGDRLLDRGPREAGVNDRLTSSSCVRSRPSLGSAA